jgi:hypothetical protein
MNETTKEVTMKIDRTPKQTTDAEYVAGKLEVALGWLRDPAPDWDAVVILLEQAKAVAKVAGR